jgi:hypothetical protein
VAFEVSHTASLRPDRSAVMTSRDADQPHLRSLARMVQITAGGRNADTHAPGATAHNPPA